MIPCMFENCHVRSRLSRMTFQFVLAATMGITLTGCITTGNLASIVRRDPMSGAPRLKNHKDPRLEELVAHLNRNSDRVQSWRASRVRIHAQGVAVPLQGRIAVERGNHVRLEVNSPRGGEVDIGSNDDQFWVWSREMKPSFVTCRHENTEIVRRSCGIPFETEWLMEALGVAPIPTEGMTLETSPTQKHEVRLVQQVVTAHGQQLRRALMVNLKKGGVVTEHSLYDYDGKLIAVAKLGSHFYDKASGAVLPHRMTLDWPKNQMAVTMEFGKIDVNPASIPSQVWELPIRRDCEIVQLDADVPANTKIASRPQGLVRIGSIEDVSEIDADDNDEELAEQTLSRPLRKADHVGHSRVSGDDDESESRSAESGSGWARFYDEEPAE